MIGATECEAGFVLEHRILTQRNDNTKIIVTFLSP